MLVCLLVFAPAVCQILAEQGDVLFFAPFEGKADAAVAAGASNPRTAKGLTFGPGKRGKAVRVNDKQPLVFAFAKNVISDEGTILMWIKPEWSSEDAVFHHLFYSGTGNHGGKFLNAIVLYKYIRRNRLMLYTSNGQRTVPAEGRTLCFKEPADIKKDEWRHLAVTWSATLAATEMSLFVNGERETSARGAVFVPEESPESFRLGGPNGTGATWFDDVLIFSRPLSGKEIRALYEAYGSDQVSSPAEIPFRQSREIQLAPYVHFGKQKLVVSADYRGSRTLMAGKPGTLELSVVQGDKTVSRSVPAVVEGVVRPELDLGKFAPGRARVEVVLQDSTGKRIRTGRITYEVPQIPGWIGNSLGKTNEVLPPWTPVAQDGKAVRVWGRAYNLAAPSILKGVTSQGQNLLRAPVELLLGVQDRNPARLSLSPEETFEKTPAAVAQNWMGSLSPIDAKAKTRIEYDGFMRIDLTLRRDVPMRVRSLTLRIPFAKAATLYHHANGAWNDLSDAGEIGPAGWSKRLPFVPYIWIGNERVGLAWFSEHNQDWWNSDESRAVELLRTKDGTDLVLRIIDKEYTLQKPVTFTFGFMATPVRPMPKGWRDWRQAFISAINLNSYVKAGWAAENCRNIGVLWSNHVGAFCHMPTKQAEMKEKVSLLRANNWQTVLSYYALNYTQTGTTEYNLMQNEWQRHPFHQHPWASKKQLSYGSLCNASSTWGDFLLHVVDKTMDATGTDGVYLDCSNPNFCKNPQHGCDPGRYPLFATRELQKRIYALVKQKRGKRGFVYNHNSENHIITTFSFSDAVLNGEQYNKKDLRTLSPEKFRAEFIPHPYGTPTFLLPTLTKFQSGRKEKMPGDEFLAFPFLHDVICVPPWLSRESQTLLKRIQKELRAFGTAKAEFLPYWSNEKFIQTDPPIRVSAYLRRDASAMMLLAQGPETDGEVTIAFRDRLSGFKGRKVSVINQERIPQWRGEGLMCPMPARKLCVFSIEATE